jgi:hypothetical protein
MQAVEDGQLVTAETATGGPKDQQHRAAPERIETILAAVGALQRKLRRLTADVVVPQEQKHHNRGGNPKQRTRRPLGHDTSSLSIG